MKLDGNVCMAIAKFEMKDLNGHICNVSCARHLRNALGQTHDPLHMKVSWIYGPDTGKQIVSPRPIYPNPNPNTNPNP
jgi:hypothetical protein